MRSVDYNDDSKQTVVRLVTGSVQERCRTVTAPTSFVSTSQRELNVSRGVGFLGGGAQSKKTQVWLMIQLHGSAWMLLQQEACGKPCFYPEQEAAQSMCRVEENPERSCLCGETRYETLPVLLVELSKCSRCRECDIVVPFLALPVGSQYIRDWKEISVPHRNFLALSSPAAEAPACTQSTEEFSTDSVLQGMCAAFPLYESMSFSPSLSLSVSMSVCLADNLSPGPRDITFFSCRAWLRGILSQV